MTRVPALLAISFLAVGCTTGLDEPLPLAEAEAMAPSELVATVHAQVSVEPAEVVMDARLWVPFGRATTTPPDLRSVGSNSGRTVHARAWDRAPLEELFVATSRGWQSYAPVIGRAGAPSAMAEH